MVIVVQDLESAQVAARQPRILLNHCLATHQKVCLVHQYPFSYNIIELAPSIACCTSLYLKYSTLIHRAIFVCSRLVRNEVEEESHLRREMEEDLAELREDYEQSNGQRMANYEAELAEWKAYEKARVSGR